RASTCSPGCRTTEPAGSRRAFAPVPVVCPRVPITARPLRRGRDDPASFPTASCSSETGWLNPPALFRLSCGAPLMTLPHFGRSSHFNFEGQRDYHCVEQTFVQPLSLVEPDVQRHLIPRSTLRKFRAKAVTHWGCGHRGLNPTQPCPSLIDAQQRDN